MSKNDSATCGSSSASTPAPDVATSRGYWPAARDEPRQARPPSPATQRPNVRYPSLSRPVRRRKAGCPSGQRERSVKPSAQPTQVRTLDLPPPAKTARDRGILRARGPSCVVSSSVIFGQEAPLHHAGYGHIADGFRAGGAVHRTACFVLRDH